MTTENTVMRFQVVEIVHGCDIEFQGVALFATLEEARTFALAHYETQIGNASEWRGTYDCGCDECSQGFTISPEWWKSYEVKILDNTDQVVETA